jgi:transcriptional regulator with XRE-family HTH domain
MTFKELRELKGFRTGVKLAAAAGVKQATISSLDYGKTTDPRWSTVEAIALALDVSPQMLMRSVRESAKAAA